jgi:hypothetical protein
MIVDFFIDRYITSLYEKPFIGCPSFRNWRIIGCTAKNLLKPWQNNKSPEFAFIILNEFSSKYLGHAYQSDELISLVQNGTNLLEVIRNILCRDEYKRKAGFS